MRRRSKGTRTLLFIDEIHRFNKAQQDAFLPHVESGDVILVGATTENPSFEVNAALLANNVIVAGINTYSERRGIDYRADTNRGACSLSWTDPGQATLVTGGVGRPEHLDRGYFVKPTIFGGVTPEMSIFREEIFGPVLSIIAYENPEEAVKVANDTPYGLAAYVSGSDTSELMTYARELRAGQIHLNYTGGGTNAPFGGFKQSGNGREKAE